MKIKLTKMERFFLRHHRKFTIDYESSTSGSDFEKQALKSILNRSINDDPEQQYLEKSEHKPPNIPRIELLAANSILSNKMTRQISKDKHEYVEMQKKRSKENAEKYRTNEISRQSSSISNIMNLTAP